MSTTVGASRPALHRAGVTRLAGRSRDAALVALRQFAGEIAAQVACGEHAGERRGRTQAGR